MHSPETFNSTKILDSQALRTMLSALRVSLLLSGVALGKLGASQKGAKVGSQVGPLPKSPPEKA
jgi:hypothetical protein